MSILLQGVLRRAGTISSLMNSTYSTASLSAAALALLKLGKLNHVAIATSDLTNATAMYRYYNILYNVKGRLAKFVDLFLAETFWERMYQHQKTYLPMV